MYLGCNIQVGLGGCPFCSREPGPESLPRGALDALLSGPDLSQTHVDLTGSPGRWDGHMAAALAT